MDADAKNTQRRERSARQRPGHTRVTRVTGAGGHNGPSDRAGARPTGESAPSTREHLTPNGETGQTYDRREQYKVLGVGSTRAFRLRNHNGCAPFSAGLGI